MTDISTLTNDELDRKIAEKRGWEKCRCQECKKHHYNIWVNTTIPDNIEDAPKYTTDPRYSFELLEELPDPEIIRTVDYWMVTPDRHASNADIVSGDNINLCRAIAEAWWLEWKGDE